MTENRVLIIGEKESFLTRVLINKLKEIGATGEFVHWGINEINSKIDSVNLITMYLDEGEKPKDDVLHFLKEKMTDHSIQMIPIGEKQEIQFVIDNTPGDQIYRSFVRPLDNAAYIEAVSAFFQKVESGDFKKTIMIVDDDPNYLGLVREWLKVQYKVIMANSGMQAIKMLAKNKVDLILLDYEMPVTNGPQVLEMIRNDEETKATPVMFLTGKSDKESVMQVMSLKPEGYFLKTIQKGELMAKLDEYFILHR